MLPSLVFLDLDATTDAPRKKKAAAIPGPRPEGPPGAYFDQLNDDELIELILKTFEASPDCKQLGKLIQVYGQRGRQLASDPKLWKDAYESFGFPPPEPGDNLGLQPIAPTPVNAAYTAQLLEFWKRAFTQRCVTYSKFSGMLQAKSRNSIQFVAEVRRYNPWLLGMERFIINAIAYKTYINGFYRNAPSRIRGDPNVALLVLKKLHPDAAFLEMLRFLFETEPGLMRNNRFIGDLTEYPRGPLAREVLSSRLSLEQRSSPAFVQMLLQHSALHFRDLAPALKANKEVAMSAIRNDSGNSMYAAPGTEYTGPYTLLSAELKKDKDVVLAAIERSGARVLSYVPPAVAAQKEIILVAIGRRGNVEVADLLAFIPAGHWLDDEFVTSALLKLPALYRYAPEEVKEKASVALKAVKADHKNVDTLPDPLLQNVDFMVSVAPFVYPEQIDSIPVALTADRAFVKALLKGVASKNPYNISSAYVAKLKEGIAPALLADAEFMADIARTTFPAHQSFLRLAPDSLKSDPVFLKAVAETYGAAIFGFAEEAALTDRIATIAVEKSARGIAEAPLSVRGNRTLMLNLVKRDGKAYQHASDELRDDEEVTKAAVSHAGNENLQYASPAMRANYDVAMLAVLVDPIGNTRHVDAALRDDAAFMRTVALRHYPALAFASARLRDDREFVYGLMLGMGDTRLAGYASSEIKVETAKMGYTLGSADRRKLVDYMLGARLGVADYLIPT
jgi:hypothetical protein